MATTVTTSELTVSITESYSLNGVEYGSTVNKVFSGNGEVFKRIMSIDTSTYPLIFDYSAEGVQDDFKYLRITNLDDTNFVTFSIFSSGNDSIFLKIKAGESFMLMDSEYEINEGSAVFTAFDKLTKISAQSDTAECDIEIFSVTA